MKKISRVLFALVLSLFMVFATGCIDNAGGRTQYVTVNVVNASEIAGKGSVSWNGGNGGSIVKGSNVTITFIEQEGYDFTGVVVNGVDKTADVSESNELILTSVNDHLNLVVEFSQSFVLGTTQSVGGVITVDNPTVAIGGSAIYTITPNTDYVIDKVMDGTTDVTSQLVDNKYTVTNVSENHNVSAVFVRLFSVTSSCGLGGAVALEKNQVKAGESVSATITPANGYEIASVKVNGTDVTNSLVNNVLTITNVSENVVVEATFASLLRTISIQNPTNGNVSASATEVMLGSNVTFTITPDANYVLESFIVNGQDKTAQVVGGSYVHTVEENVSASATFVRIYSASVTSSANGTVSLNKNQVKAGESVSATITPANGYVIASVKVNGTDVTNTVSNNVITVNNVNSDVVIEVTFRSLTYTVSVFPPSNGSVVASSNQGTDGETIIFTITPNTNYELTSLLINGVESKDSIVNGKFYYLTLTENVEVSARFTKIKYTIEIEESENGSVTCQDEILSAGDTAMFVITPDEDYVLDKLFVNNKVVTVNGNVYYHKMDKNVTVKAVFKLNAFDVTVEPAQNGSVVASSQTAIVGETVTFSITPDAHYELESFVVNGQNKTAEVVGGAYSHTVNGAVNVSATFKLVDYTVVANVAENGSLSADKQSAKVGEIVTFAIVPTAHYELESFVVNGADKTAEVVDGTYTHTIDSSVNASATFKLIDYTVSGISTDEGSVTANTASATVGETVTFTLNKNAGYEGYTLVAFKVNGQNKLDEVVDGKYEHVVDGNVEITEYVLSRIDYVIETEATENGEIELSVAGALLNEEIEITLVPDAHYEIESFSVDGEDKTAELVDGKFVIVMTKNVSVSATFKAKQYTVTVEESEN